MAVASRAGSGAQTAPGVLIRRALEDATLPAVVAAGATFVLILLARLPGVGGAFALLGALLGWAAYPVAGFLVAAHLQRFYHGPTRTLLATLFGLGTAAAVTAALSFAAVIGGLLLIAGDATGVLQAIKAIGVLLGHTLAELIPRLAGGTLLAALGGFVAFDRERLSEELAHLLPKV